MSVAAIIKFFVVEFVIFAVMMLALYGVKTYVSDAEVKKWVSLIVIVLCGGAMLIYLANFAGVF